MKKFLTVLLVIAVMFTFSFSSAFAAQTEAEKYNTAITDAQAAMAKAVNTYAKTLVYDQAGNITGASYDTNLTKTAIDKTIAEIIADYNAEIVRVAATKFTDGAWSDSDTSDVEAVYSGEDWEDVLFSDYDSTLYGYAVEEAYGNLEKEIAKVTVADYAVSEQDAIQALITTNQSYVTEAKAAVKAESADSSLLNAFVKTAGYIATFKASFDTSEDVTKTGTYNATYNTVAYMNVELTKIKSIKTEAARDVATAFKPLEKARLEAIIADKTNSATEISSAELKLNSLDSNVAKVLEAIEADINTPVIKDTATEAVLLGDYTSGAWKAVNDVALTAFPATVNATTVEAFYNAVNALSTNETLAAYAANYAETLKATYVTQTGKLMYNASTVDAALVEINKVIGTSVYTYADIEAWFLNETNCPKAATEETQLENVLAVAASLIDEDTKVESDTLKKENQSTSVFEAITVTGIPTTTLKALKLLVGDFYYTNWTDEDQTAIKDIQKEYAKKIAAASDAETAISLVKEAQKAMSAMLNADQLSTLDAAVGAQLETLNYVSDYDAATKNLSTAAGAFLNYVKGVAAKDAANTYDDKTLVDAVYDAVQLFLDAAEATQNPKLYSDNAAIKALISENYPAALALLDAVKPDSVLKADREALEAAIKALPTNATLENKADYIAVKGQYDDYMAVPGVSAPANEALLKSYISKIVGLEKTAVETAIKALPEYAKIAITDKTNVESARALVDAYEDTYGDGSYKALDGWGYQDITDTYVEKLARDEAQLSTLEIAEVTKAIAALPENVKLEDKAAVDAAKAAYDALTEEQKAAMDGNAEAAKLVAKLEAAVAQVGTLDDEKAEAEKAANDAYVKGVCENVTLKFNGKRTASGKTAFYFGEKGSAKLQKLEDLGYVLEFKYYKAESKTKPTAPKCNIYMSTSKGKKTSDNGYQMIPTKGTQGKYYAYAAEINVYDAEDNLIATIAKDQVNFGWAKWTGKTVK